MVRSEAAFKIREAVNSQRDARIIVLDLSGVRAIEAGGLGMLLFLQRWAHNHDIRLKLFSPPSSLQNRPQRVRSIPEFDILTLDDMMKSHAVLAWISASDDALPVWNSPDLSLNTRGVARTRCNGATKKQ